MATLQIPTARAFAPLLANTTADGRPVRYKCARGGRGSGKSRFFAGLLVEEQIASPIDAVCLREVQKSLEFSVKREISEAIASMNAGAYFDVQDKRIIGNTGCVTIFEGMQNHTADSIKSLARFRRAWVEEAHSLSQRSLDVLRPTIRDDGSQIWFSWNPEHSTDPVDALFCGGPPPAGTILVQANYDANPWFPSVLRAEMEYDRSRDPDKYAHVWLGSYLQRSEARVFKNWRIEEFDTPADAVLRFGADWGFSIDPTVLVRCYAVGRTLYVDHEAYQIGCDITNTPDLFLSVPQAERWPIVADSSRPETISHMQRNGFPKMYAAVKGARSLEEGVEWLQSFELVVHPRCQHLIDELTLYSYKVDKDTDKVLPVLQDKDNHLIDALRYACEGARRIAQAKPKVERKRPAVHGSWMG